MNSDEYAREARGLPKTALAIKLCELADIDTGLVSKITIDCLPGQFPVATFALALHDATSDAVVEEVKHYELRLVGGGETP